MLPKRQRQEILLGNTLQYAPTPVFEAEPPVIARLAQHNAASCTKQAKPSKAAADECLTDTSALKLWQNRYWAKTMPMQRTI